MSKSVNFAAYSLEQIEPEVNKKCTRKDLFPSSPFANALAPKAPP